MIEHRNTDLSLAELANAAFEAAAEDVIRRARETGTNIVIWRDGAIAYVSPDDFEKQPRKSDQGQESA